MKYDATLFKGTAKHYVEGRPNYPQKMFDKIISDFNLTEKSQDVLLDLGCGTGEFAIPLAKYFSKVLAWDPDPEMLEIAQEKIRTAGIGNIEIAQKSSDDLGEITPNSVKLVTMGQSFHWMDGEKTLRELQQILAQDGGIVIAGVKHGLNAYSGEFDEPNETTAERNRIVKETVIKYLGAERRAGEGNFKRGNKSFEELLQDASFSSVEEIRFETQIYRSVNETLEFIYSTSWGNRDQLGEQADAFDRELREKLEKISPAAGFEETLRWWMFIAKKQNSNFHVIIHS